MGFRPFWGALLVVAMTLASLAQGYAQARGTPDVDGLLAVVLCADGETQVVYLNDDGVPVEPDRCMSDLCAACLSSVVHATAPATGRIAARGAWRMWRAPMAERVLPVSAFVAGFHPRGPPARPETEGKTV